MKIECLRLEYPISAVARALNISRSGIYHILKEGNKSMNKLDRIREKYVHLKYQFDSLCKEFPKYGYRRIRIMLRRRYKIYLSKKTVQWIMRAFNLSLPVKKERTTRPHTEKVKITRPYQLWQTDMTKVWVNGTGWMYLFGVIDCFTREIVGWCFSLFASAKEALKALEMAIDVHFPNGIPEGLGLTLNSDNGCQFGSRAYLSAVKDLGITFTRTGYDTPEENAYIESFFGKLKEEEVWLKEYESISDAEQSIRDWIYKYNYERIHSSLGYLTPIEFKEKWFSEGENRSLLLSFVGRSLIEV
jgi:putative transposase